MIPKKQFFSLTAVANFKISLDFRIFFHKSFSYVIIFMIYLGCSWLQARVSCLRASSWKSNPYFGDAQNIPGIKVWKTDQKIHLFSLSHLLFFPSLLFVLALAEFEFLFCFCCCESFFSFVDSITEKRYQMTKRSNSQKVEKSAKSVDLRPFLRGEQLPVFRFEFFACSKAF